MATHRPKVLIVDDSPLFRRVLSMGLEMTGEFEVMRAVSSAAEARAVLRCRRPDVIALDIEMPNENGLSFLRYIMANDPIPTVIVSSLTSTNIRLTVEAMESGAVDVVSKPSGSNLQEGMFDILRRLLAATNAKPKPLNRPLKAHQVSVSASAAAYAGDWVLAIGSSTGGVQALTTIIPMLPAETPPVVVVQHMPQGFTSAFAKRLNASSPMNVREAEDGDILEQGSVLIAPGGQQHMIVRSERGQLRARLIDGDPVCYSRPAVDVLFKSLPDAVGAAVSAAILTGMGRDGTEGLSLIRASGGATIVQDEATSQIYGMPARAWEAGAAEQQLPLEQIPQALISTVGQRRRSGATRANGPDKKIPPALKGAFC